MASIISWNVNGFRAVLRKGFEDFFAAYQPDIICLQEVKAQRDDVDFAPAGYHVFWNSAAKKGYSGVAVYSRVKPLEASAGLGIEKHDQEGRVLTLEYPNFFLVNVYTPNAQNELRRLDYRSQQWDKDFLAYVKSLETKKPVIFCGDLNVAHKEIDLANPKTNVKNAGFTIEERQGFDNIVDAGFVDTFRAFNDQPHQYTWWSYRAKARERNVGWRIDYFCASKNLMNHIESSEILADVHGSDHCPILLKLNSKLL